MIPEPERRRIHAALADLAGPVVVRHYTSDVDSWYSQRERALLETIAAASPHVTLEGHPGHWDPAREAAVKIARTPAIAVAAGARDTGIRYYGAPDGYELAVFLGVLRVAGGAPSRLAAASLERLQRLAAPVHLEVLVSPT